MEASAQMTRIPPWEAMLIRLLLDSEEACQELGPLLEKGGLLSELVAGTIVRTLLGMVASGATPDMASLTDRLEENQQRALAQVVFNTGGVAKANIFDEGPFTIADVKHRIRDLERLLLEKRRVALQQSIQEARKLQDDNRAVELLREWRELDKELGRLI